MTAEGVVVKVITHGAANVPEPVTAVVAIPALVSAVLRFVDEMFQASGAVVIVSTVSKKVPPTAGLTLTLRMVPVPVTFSMRPVLSIVTVVGADVKVITQGVVDVPEPVTEVVAIPALVSAVLRFVDEMFQARGAVVWEPTVSAKVPPTAGLTFTL